jgi:predicted ribosome quality control (RQC) complex YloA/Tae2 family protein
VTEEQDAYRSDRDAGVWAGKSVARRFVSPDGFTVLVGRTAHDNDLLTFKLASPNDLWLHIASGPGSHVVIRNPDNLAVIPRDTLLFAAALAAGYSSARKGGRTAVHVAERSEISKPRGFAPGKVTLRRYRTVQAKPSRGEESV